MIIYIMFSTSTDSLAKNSLFLVYVTFWMFIRAKSLSSKIMEALNNIERLFEALFKYAHYRLQT